MRRVFKTRQFAKWMRKTDLTDDALCLAVSEMVSGLVDADLGGDVLKKRVALPGVTFHHIESNSFSAFRSHPVFGI